jgi:hypothetical protein
MIPLSSAASGGLTWSKIPRSRNYEFKLNGKVWGSLRRPGFWSSTFVAETEDGRWTFQRAGFFHTGAEILDSATGHQIATFKPGWGSRGMLVFAGGEAFRFECTGFWHPVWTVAAENGQPVLSLRPRGKTFDAPPGKLVSESQLGLLMMFTLYRVLQAEEDASAAVMIAAS